MEKDFLLEIGVEEIPHNYLTEAHNQFESLFKEFFTNNSLSYSRLSVYSTPRRLAILVEKLPSKQEDKKILKKGPAKNIAYSENGEPTQALKGFLNSVSDLEGETKIMKENGKEFIFFEGIKKGKETKELLKTEIPKILEKIKFPKTMKWSDTKYYFVRPIRWIVCIFGNEVIDLEIAKVKSSNLSKGHRFIGEDTEIENPSNYEYLLESKGKVIPSPEKRKKIILDKINEIKQKTNLEPILPEKLLNEIVNLVEYPDCAVGSFESKFLEIPNEILVSEMIDHQKVIPLTKNGKLVNQFIIVTNTIPNEKIIKGNEKVISARLNDGKFLYEEDLKKSINFFIEKTKELVFFGGLGTIYDKMSRMKNLTEILCNKLGIKNKEEIVIASSISKFDLTTGVVYEFPELQGIMGYYYTLAFKKNQNIANYIKEHYKPISSEDELPKTEGGSIISIADKLDNIFSLYSAGEKVSGSSDPYGLRRQVVGISRICINNKYDLEISEIFEESIEIYKNFLSKDKNDVKSEIEQLFSARLKSLFKEMKFKTDEIESTIKKTTNPYDAYLRVKAINNFRNRGDFIEIAILFKRIRNILIEANFSKPKNINVEILSEEEKKLYNLILSKKETISEHITEKKYEDLLETLLEFKDPIHIFFEKVFVMDQNIELRENRLSILYELYSNFEKFIDFNVMEFS
ncbi:MAG: glycine--tRNA ligase subunit beta [Brevinematia bacterium]